LPEVRIETDFGEVAVSYNNLSELELGLQNLDKVMELVMKNARNIIKPRAKTGFGDLIGLTNDGLVEVYKSPDTDLKTVILVLFAYHPKGATVEQISKSSCVKQVARNYLTPGGYRKYFTKLSKNEYGLTREGLTFATSIIIPELRAAVKQ
jgi:hypothetical protein